MSRLSSLQDSSSAYCGPRTGSDPGRETGCDDRAASHAKAAYLSRCNTGNSPNAICASSPIMDGSMGSASAAHALYLLLVRSANSLWE